MSKKLFDHKLMLEAEQVDFDQKIHSFFLPYHGWCLKYVVWSTKIVFKIKLLLFLTLSSKLWYIVIYFFCHLHDQDHYCFKHMLLIHSKRINLYHAWQGNSCDKIIIIIAQPNGFMTLDYICSSNNTFEMTRAGLFKRRLS